MRKRLFLAFVLALTLVAFPVVSALAGNIIHFSRATAVAGFSSSSTDPLTGCNVITSVFVFATEGRLQNPPSPRSTTSTVDIGGGQFDDCTGSGVSFSGFAMLADADFQVSRILTSATLNTSIPVTVRVCDGSGNCTFGTDVVGVDLTWTGIGAVSRENGHFHRSLPNCIVNGRFNGTSRSAEASGSVTFAATNFSPNPSEFADLLSAKSGQVEIGCGF